MSEHAPGPSTLGKPTRRLPADAYTHISTGSFFLACYLCCLVLILTIASSGRFVHWFVLPVWMCGVLGYMTAYTESEGFQGMGWVFMISESFPIIALMGFAVYAHHRRVGYSWSVIIGVLLVYLSFKLFFGGLRGSRSNTIWGLFWAVGIIHFWVRQVPKKVILVGIVFLISFMYLYGFYKALGVEALEAFKTSEGVTALAG